MPSHQPCATEQPPTPTPDSAFSCGLGPPRLLCFLSQGQSTAIIWRSQKAVTICLPPTNILGRKRFFLAQLPGREPWQKLSDPLLYFPGNHLRSTLTVTISAHAQRTLTRQGQQCRQSCVALKLASHLAWLHFP